MADIPTIETVKLTAKGLRLLAKVQAGALSQFTRAAIGDGFMPDDQDVAGLTAMISEIPSHQTGEEATSATVDITRITHGEGTVTLRIKIKNGDMSFYLRELGIMAQDPDEGEILYAYINFGDGASAMPAFDGSTYVSRNIDLTFIVSNTANVNANVTLPAEVSYEEFENHRKANVLDHPDHSVTYDKLALELQTKITDMQTNLSKLYYEDNKRLYEIISIAGHSPGPCDNTADYDLTYDEYSSGTNKDTDILTVPAGATTSSCGIPKNNNLVDFAYFIAFQYTISDYVHWAQLIIYSDGTIYQRWKLLYDGKHGVNDNPQYTEWMEVPSVITTTPIPDPKEYFRRRLFD